MMKQKQSARSFNIRPEDKDIDKWVSHQHNLSNSLRWLIKQAIAEYGLVDYQDAFFKKYADENKKLKNLLFKQAGLSDNKNQEIIDVITKGVVKTAKDHGKLPDKKAKQNIETETDTIKPADDSPLKQHTNPPLASTEPSTPGSVQLDKDSSKVIDDKSLNLLGLDDTLK